MCHVNGPHWCAEWGALIRTGLPLSAFGLFHSWLLYKCIYREREREMRDLFWFRTLWFSLSCSGARRLQTGSSGRTRCNKEQKSRAELSHYAAPGPGKTACIFNVLLKEKYSLSLSLPRSRPSVFLSVSVVNKESYHYPQDLVQFNAELFWHEMGSHWYFQPWVILQNALGVCLCVHVSVFVCVCGSVQAIAYCSNDLTQNFGLTGRPS